jgi:hypothetical protein
MLLVTIEHKYFRMFAHEKLSGIAHECMRHKLLVNRLSAELRIGHFS